MARSPVSQSVFQKQPDPIGVVLEQEEGIKELSPESDPMKPISGTDVQLQRVSWYLVSLHALQTPFYILYPTQA